MQGIHSLVILILLLHNVELAEISSEQAMQMATKMRGCIDLKPGDHLPADYLEKMLGQWYEKDYKEFSISFIPILGGW